MYPMYLERFFKDSCHVHLEIILCRPSNEALFSAILRAIVPVEY